MMVPEFSSMAHYVERLGDRELWRACLDAVMEEQGLQQPGAEILPGVGAPLPTFVVGDIVDK